jgi:hypothetical protein
VTSYFIKKIKFRKVRRIYEADNDQTQENEIKKSCDLVAPGKWVIVKG